MVLVLALTRGKNSRDVSGLFVIHPEPAHGVMHAGENLHGRVPRIVALNLFVDLENAFQLSVENLAINMRQVEIDHRLSIDPKVMLIDHFEDRARSHIAWHKVAVFRIPLFQEIPALALRNGFGIALVPGSSWNPHASPLAPRRLRHQAQLVFTGNGSGMNLNEFTVSVIAALLIQGRLRRSGTDDRVGRLAKN